MLESAAKQLLSRFGIAVPRAIVASTPEEAAERAGSLRFPVVAKVLSTEIAHKTDVGAVRVGLKSQEEVVAAAAGMLLSLREHLPGAPIQGFLIEEMVPPGIEVLVGIIRDDVFGMVLGFGLGGVYAEAYDDVVFRVAPLRRWDAEELLDEIRGARILKGFRTTKPNREGLIHLLLAVAGVDGLVSHFHGTIKELELNPVVVGNREVVVLDAKLKVKD